jgi:hypothetical protein
LNRLAERAVGWVALAAAGYAAIQVVRYFLPPHIPRYQVESAFIVLVTLGALAVLVRGGTSFSELEMRFRDEAGRPGSLPAIAAGFVLAAFVLYAPALGIGLLADDYVIADWASRLELIHFSATGFIRPGVPLFWAMLGPLPGNLATAAHAANIALHGVNAVLVTLVALRLDLPRRGAIAAGTIFVLCSGMSEAIVWASGVQDVLMTTLVLAAVVLATARPDPKIVAAIITAVCAVLVKETAVVTPLLVALVLAARGGLRHDRSEWTVVGSLFAVSGAYLVLRLVLGVPSSFLTVADWRYLLKQLVAGVFATLGAPWTDAWWRSHTTLATVRALAIVGLLASAFSCWRRGDLRFRQAAAAAIWVLVAIAPVFSLFFVGPFLEGARYVYLPAAAFSILLAVLAGTAADWIARPGGGRLLAFASIIAVVVVSAVPSAIADLERWRRAAASRDTVLEVVRDSLDRLACTSFTVQGSADTIDGAYVFRNGLREALGLRDRTPPVPCRVVGADGTAVVLAE